MTLFLKSSPEIDFEHPSIQELLEERGWRNLPPEEGARTAFLFVRDRIAHSYDVQDPRVTFRASECLEHRVGLCYSKSHLLASLMRGLGIPASIRYQKLRLASGDFCLHAFNSIELDGHWLDLDARGNNDQVRTEFSTTEPSLAFKPDADKGESIYAERFVGPPPTVCEALRQTTNVLTMRLPDSVA